MQQLIILIVALALAGGVYLFLTISKKKNKEQTEENAVEMMTANEMINVKDIRNNCLHTKDGYTFTFIEIGGMSMELFSESEKLAYCKNITSIVSRFQFPYKYMAISSPYVIKHMVTADSNRLKMQAVCANTNCRFRGEVSGSDKASGFLIESEGMNDCVYVFESFIDAMSHANLYK